VILEPLTVAKDRLGQLEHWGQAAIHEVIEAVAADYDITMGKLGQPIRVAVTSGPVSPPIDVTLWLVGQRRSIERLERAVELIEARVAASAG
jgi:glutamyl-tRNA synthetase